MKVCKCSSVSKRKHVNHSFGRTCHHFLLIPSLHTQPGNRSAVKQNRPLQIYFTVNATSPSLRGPSLRPEVALSSWRTRPKHKASVIPCWLHGAAQTGKCTG
ncbi:hypothetical protein AOLI_G00070480 [Acnodon oligacanthus]